MGPFRLEDFIRADQNGDNVLTMREFMLGDVDDDRGDRFAYLDMNNNNRIDRTEWHGGEAAFRWLDRNADGQLSRTEVAGTGARHALAAAGRTGAGVRDPARAIASVRGRPGWTPGIDLRAGDLLLCHGHRPSCGRLAPPRPIPMALDPAGSNAPLPGAGAGALIGRIGNTQAFMVGTNLDGHRANTAGRLFLMVNDDVLTDNQGNFRATIIVERRR